MVDRNQKVRSRRGGGRNARRASDVKIGAGQAISRERFHISSI